MEDEDSQVHVRNTVLGQEFKQARLARKWSQTMVCRKTGLRRGVIVKIEGGDPARSPNYQRYAEALGMRLGLVPSDLAAGDVGRVDEIALATVATRVLSVIVEVEKEIDVVDRRQLIVSLATVLMDAAVPRSVRQLFTEDRCPALTPDDVAALAADCGRYLQRLDATSGGGIACDAAVAMHRQASMWASCQRHTPRVTRELDLLSCDLGAWVSWLSFDAGRPAIAERYLERTITQARLAGCRDAEVRALDTMVLLLERRGQLSKAMQAARAGGYASEQHSCQPALALFHLRAAKVSALMGNPSGFADDSRTARSLLQSCELGTAPLWLQFLTTGAYDIGGGHLALGHAKAAMSEFASIVEDPTSNYHRDVVMAKVKMGQALALEGDLTQAAELGSNVLAEVMALSSDSAKSELRQLRNGLAEVQVPPRAAKHFVAAYDETITTTTWT